MHRFSPWFTLLSLLVMLALLIAEIAVNQGIQPIGIGTVDSTVNTTGFGNVTVTQDVSVGKNMWIGPSTATLIKMVCEDTCSAL